MSIRDVMLGQTTIERLKPPVHRFVFFPASQRYKGQSISVGYFLALGERLHDLGWKENIRRLIQQPLFHDGQVEITGYGLV